MGAVLDEPVDDDRADHENCEREGDDDVARHREKARNHAEHVRREHEHEQREDEGEELHSLLAGRVAERAGDEIMQNLGDRLGAARNDGAVARGEEQTAHDHGGGSDHEQGRVREIDDRNDGLDLELLDRAGHDPSAARAGIAVSCSWPIEVGASPLVFIPGGFHHSGSSHQVEHPGAEAEYETDDEPPWGDAEQPVDDPPDDSASEHSRDEFGRKPEGLAERSRVGR